MAHSYRLLDHTSDLGLEIYGRDYAELFRNAAFALFDNITGLEDVESRTTWTLTLSSSGPEELLLDWLRELLFRFSTDYFITREVKDLDLTPTAAPVFLSARVLGEKFDQTRHRTKIEIKTPTYHQFRITRSPAGYAATIIFDV